MRSLFGILLLSALPLQAQTSCEQQPYPLPRISPTAEIHPRVRLDPTILRLVNYTAIESKHRLNGLASYYSRSLDGTLTANGERYRNKRFTAAHLTLPLGCWVEVQSVATGKKIRLRVNDRGPYVKKFCIDLSRAAARAIGVDVADDRRVLIHIIALPGESPLPEEALEPASSAILASGR